jgi:hypothetical protein
VTRLTGVIGTPTAAPCGPASETVSLDATEKVNTFDAVCGGAAESVALTVTV